MKSPLIAVFLLTILAVACNNSKPGCTDNNAINYDYNATSSDGTCIYEAQPIVYWTLSYYNNVMADSGSTTITAYLDGELVGSAAAADLYIGPEDCDDLTSAHFTTTIYYNQTYKRLKVTDEQGHLFFDSDIQVQEGCNYLQVEQ
jgi:hypothetical protein